VAADAEPAPGVLRLYGEPSTHEAVPWAWVDEQLRAAGTYWVVAATPGLPHPRPVWGVWHGRRLHLSVGSPVLQRYLAPGAPVVVHLDSGTDVVLVEGAAAGTTAERSVLDPYDAKYGGRYDVDELGPLTVVAPRTVKAWRSAGWAGQDGFAATGRWRLDG
jgi:hypothetical protein